MLTVEQIKTLINGLKQPLMSIASKALKAEETAKKALNSSDQALSSVSAKMERMNPVGEGSFSLNREPSTTIGKNSFAEGSYTKASGEASHAEGSSTEALGAYSHAEGRRTIAEGVACHVEGQSNLPLTGEYLHIVGNGDGYGSYRSNAHTLDWGGNAWFQGDVFIDSYSGTHRDEGSVRLAKITEVIPAPVKAEVGQVLRISAVDENGVPTAWEPLHLNKGSLPNVGGMAGSEVTLALENNVEYHCSDPVTALTLQGFTPAEDGKVSMWAIQFTAGSSITVIIPNTVRWAIAEPVFDADVTYWLSFVPLVNGEILGVWVSNE